jgi:hypothetical protein
MDDTYQQTYTNQYLPVNSCFELGANTEHRQTCIVFDEEIIR